MESSMQKLARENQQLKLYCLTLLVILAAMSVKYWGLV